MSYPSTQHAVSPDRSVSWSGSDSAGLKGRWEIPLEWAAPMPPTDVVIFHWNLNQTINIRQLSCSKKQRCLHNSACQDTLAGFIVCDGGCFYCQTPSWKCLLKTSFYFNLVSEMQNLASKRLVNTKCLDLTGLFSFLSGFWIHLRKKHEPSSQDKIHHMWRDETYCTH